MSPEMEVDGAVDAVLVMGAFVVAMAIVLAVAWLRERKKNSRKPQAPR